MTHSLEVSQNARTIAKALRLNEDLVEAIALGHDLGHTPFGHAGERALNEICPYPFEHSEQSVRLVEVLEKDGRGLNLSFEVRDGIRNHQTAGMPSTLEGKIVRFSDKIAYIYHDTDDAIRGGIIQEQDVPVAIRQVLGETSKERLNHMIHDVVANSQDKPDVMMSKATWDSMLELRKFLFEEVYDNHIVKKEEGKSIRLVQTLYKYYLENINLLPQDYLQLLDRGTPREIVVCDYIASMSDKFVIANFESLTFQNPGKCSLEKEEISCIILMRS
jgi:dGTPase